MGEVEWGSSTGREFSFLLQKLHTDLVFKYIEPESIKGKVMIFAVARILDLGYLYGLVRWVFGYRPKDDAPELPN